MLRSKANAEHGGGQEGRDAVQAAIDAGLYASRMVERKGIFGKVMKLEEVCIPIDKTTEGHKISFTDKITGKVNTDTKKAIDMIDKNWEKFEDVSGAASSSTKGKDKGERLETLKAETGH
eukprot:5695922-Lingulodinium_polyedra.AAC.1